MNLSLYEQHKFSVAELLRAASNLAPVGDQVLRERLHDLFIRLAEDRFNLVVVGRFNRGKTSLMNALLGSGHLPVGIVPLTSVITTVSYGTMEGVVLSFYNRTLTTNIPLDELSKYITENGNPSNARGIKVADVKLRAEILRRGFFFVDTPGLGSAIIQNTLTTEAYLPEADAFLLVTSYESPLTEEEVRFLREVSASARRVFIIVNKQDTVTTEQRAAVLAYVSTQLGCIFGDSMPRVFSVSARDGLDAKRTRSQQGLSESGISGLETELTTFLLEDKRDHFLRQMCRRAAEVIRTLPATPEASTLASRTSTLFERFSGPGSDLEVLASAAAARTPSPPSLAQLRTCEICSSVSDAIWDFERQFQYDISVDPRAQRHFVITGGLCNFHTWQYNTTVSPYGVCTAYPALLDRVARWFRSAAEEASAVKNDKCFGPPIASHDHCPLCAARTKAESAAIEKLTARFVQKGEQALESLSAVCVPHVCRLAATLENADLVRLLMRHQAQLLERLSEDMQRFALKRDARRRYLETKEEEAAAHRALLIIAGHRDVTAATEMR